MNLDQAFNRSSITAEEIATLYSNVVATQNIMNGKRSGAAGIIHKKINHNLNQTFYWTKKEADYLYTYNTFIF